MIFRFETQDVPVPATEWIRDRLGERRGGWLFGRMGTGKSHAVRKAVPDGLHVDVSPGPLLIQRFVADMARQLGARGRPLLEALRAEGLDASLDVAEHVVNGQPLVVDAADRLLPSVASLDDPAATLWQDERQVLLDWVRGRTTRSPTFLVGRRAPHGVDSVHSHEAPQNWPIQLRETDSGYRNWPLLGRIARHNPAVLTLARALVPLLPADTFNTLVEQAADDEASPFVLLQRLGMAFQASAPPAWQRALSIVGALGDIPRDAIESVLDGRSGAAAGERLSEQIAGERSALDRLRELNLVEERAGRISLLPALIDAGAIRPLTLKEREHLLPAVAHALLAPVNDLRSLGPDQAARVLGAHAIFVELGDMALAERTAVLHVHGLVALARRTSQNEQYRDAWQQYDSLLRMMQAGTWSTKDRTGRRLLSYVRHYRSRDGALAGMLDDAACLVEYQQALADWPENALWHQRVIECFLRLGRPIEAMQAVDAAHGAVEPHPRRDEFLRLRPAGTALRSGLPLLSLELIEPVLDLPADLYPEVADGCAALLRRWEKGLAVSDLPFRLAEAEGRLVFLDAVDVHLRRAGAMWTSGVARLGIDGRSERPRAAIEELARLLASETRRLVSTPTSNLGVKDVRMKGRLLSIVDVLNSDIGLVHAADRWVLGRFVDGKLVPTMRHLPPIEVPEELLPESTEGLYLVLVPVHRDGAPSGPATKVEPAGSGHDTRSLLGLLARMSEDTG